MAEAKQRKLIGHAGERRHRHQGIVDAYRAGEVDWEAEAADLAKEHGRRFRATHTPMLTGTK
jgi:hypothetical protein